MVLIFYQKLKLKEKDEQFYDWIPQTGFLIVSFVL